MPRKVEISHRTIVFTVIFLGAVLLIYHIRDIVLTLFAALLVMAILNPLVRRLSKFKIPRGASVLIVYLIFFGIIGVAIASLIPAVIDQTTNLAYGLPSYINSLHLPSVFGDQIYKDVFAKLGDLPGGIVNLGVSIVSNIFGVITILTFAFYLLMARDKLDDQLAVLVGNKKSNEIGAFLDELEVKLGGWARGQMVLMVSVGLFSYVGLRLIGVPYALALGLLAGLLEAVPYVGPILAAIPAVVIGFGISPVMGIATTALAFLIQQVENYVLVPKIMEKSVGVTPIVSLLGLPVGLKLAGITGVLISIPVVITIQVLIKRRFLM